MRSRNVRNYREEEQARAAGPDCTTCILRAECARAAENSYCTQYRSRAAEERLPDPNELWKRGEEVEF